MPIAIQTMARSTAGGLPSQSGVSAGEPSSGDPVSELPMRSAICLAALSSNRSAPDGSAE